jgi:hypothetical protein
MEEARAGLDLHPRTALGAELDGIARRAAKDLISWIRKSSKNEKPDGGGDPSGLSNLIDNWEEECCRSKSKGAGRRSAPFDDLNLAGFFRNKIADIAKQLCTKCMAPASNAQIYTSLRWASDG